jgi:putative phosphoribosyl transferase
MKLKLKSKFPFRDRDQAARILCEKLFQFRGLNPLILGLSPESVPMACLLARYLKGEADIFFVEKIYSPENPNLTLGALAENGVFTLAPGGSQMWVPPHFLEEEKRRVAYGIQERRKLYTPHRPALSPVNRLVIMMDDVSKSGLSLWAAYQGVDGSHPAQVVVAVPIATSAALELLRRETEEAIALWTGDQWSNASEIYEINLKMGEEDAAQFLQPLNPELYAVRGRVHPEPSN